MTKRLLFFSLLTLLSLNAFAQSPDPALLWNDWKHLENGSVTLLRLEMGGRFSQIAPDRDSRFEGFYKMTGDTLVQYETYFMPSDGYSMKDADPLPGLQFNYRVTRLDAQYLELEDLRNGTRTLYERKSE